VRSFGRLMQAPDTGDAVRDALRKAVAEHAAQCLFSEVSDGDAVLIVHDEANAIVNVALRLSEDLFDAPGNPQLRIAIDHGVVRLADAGDGRIAVVGGEPLLRVARVEPFVEPGEIWGTDEFRHALEAQPSRYQATLIAFDDRERNASGAINVCKQHSGEGDIWVRLYRIEARRHGDAPTPGRP
jgi:class 3 adenylate cyclase